MFLVEASTCASATLAFAIPRDNAKSSQHDLEAYLPKCYGRPRHTEARSSVDHLYEELQKPPGKKEVTASILEYEMKALSFGELWTVNEDRL